MSTDDEALSPETRSLLARGRRGHALSDGHRRALKRALLVNVATGGVATTTTAAAAWTSVAAKIIGTAALVAVVGGGVYEATSPRGNGAGGPAATAQSSKVAVSPPLPQLPQPREGHVPGPTSQPGTTSTPRTTTPAPPLVGEARPVREHDLSLPKEAEPLAPPPALPSVTVTYSPMVPSPEISAASQPLPAASSSPAPPATASPKMTTSSLSPSASLEAEAALLGEADQALKAGDSSAALRLLDEHAKRYPTSALEPERSADRVLALCGVGRVADARRAALLFLAAHPSGPLASRVTSSCGMQAR